MASYMIASTVRSRGALLVPGDRKHSERVEGLSLGLYERPAAPKKF